MNKEIKKYYCVMALKNKLGENTNELFKLVKGLIMSEYNLSSKKELNKKMDELGDKLEKEFKTVGDCKKFLEGVKK